MQSDALFRKYLPIGLLLLAACHAGAQERPAYNIILIMADDAGVETIGTYGGNSHATPEINRLAAEGMRFDYAHSQPICTPSRVKIMTGQHNYRNYEEFAYLRPEVTTFAHAMQAAGYRTLVAGKWQLAPTTGEQGVYRGLLPEDAGFDEHFVGWPNPDRSNTSNYGYWWPSTRDNSRWVDFDEGVFSSDLYNQRVLEFIEAHRAGPFFVYYPMLLPHVPFVPTPDAPEAVTAEDRFAAMVAYMDKLVGRVRAKVVELGIAEQTVILFTADNGTDSSLVNEYRGMPLKGGKGSTLLPGTHVPFIAWGGPTLRGRANADLIDFTDVFPTLLELAAVEDTGGLTLDGHSLVPKFRGEAGFRRDAIFIHYDPKWGPPGQRYQYAGSRYVFDRNWKLYSDGRFYDIQWDPEETYAISTSGGLRPTARQAFEHLRAILVQHPNSPNWGEQSVDAPD